MRAAHVPRWLISLLLLSLGFAVTGGCSRKATTAQGTGDLPVTEVGKCENVSLDDATCKLREVVVTRLDPGRPGTKVVRVTHNAVAHGTSYRFDSYQLAVPEGRIKELEAFFKAHSPVPCEGVIVRPPCNPDATTVTLTLTLPSYVTPHR